MYYTENVFYLNGQIIQTKTVAASTFYYIIIYP